MLTAAIGRQLQLLRTHGKLQQQYEQKIETYKAAHITSAAAASRRKCDTICRSARARELESI